MNTQEVNNYVKSHGKVLPNGQVFLTKPLFVFKMAYSNSKIGNHRERAIVNLIIPKGSLVNLADYNSKKMRASMAVCHSIVGQNSRKQLPSAYSRHDSSFKYHPLDKTSKQNLDIAVNQYYSTNNHWCYIPESSILVTDLPFATTKNECDSGVHFFVELKDAQNY